MVADGRENGLTDLAHLECVCRILKLLERLIGTDPGQHAATDSRLGILGDALGQFGKVRTLAQCLVGGVDACLGLLLFLFSGRLGQSQQDVGRLDEVLALQAGHHAIVVVTYLLLLCSFRDEERTYLLVAVLAELLLETGERVEVIIQGSLYLHLVVDEELGILAHRLLVDDTFGVVLIVVIFKFAAGNCHTIDGHHDGVILCCSRQCCHSQRESHQYLFHSLTGVCYN